MTHTLDVLLTIKIAEEQKNHRWKLPSREEWKQLGKNTLAYGAGMGAGTGLGYVLKKKVLPRALPQMGPKTLTALGYGGGALLGLAGTAALRHAMKMTEAARE